jgi:hypothetical protein
MSNGARLFLALGLLSGACASGTTTPPPPVGGVTTPTPTPPADAAPPPSSTPGPVSTPSSPDAATPTGGSGGGEGSSSQPDAAPSPPTSSPDGGGGTVTPPSDTPDSETYSCTLMFGINATQEWWKQGFETLVNNDHWELTKVHSGFIELWADPNNAIWNTGIDSACAQNSKTPDRIIFVALNFDFTTLDQWLPPMMATAKNLRMKYPSAKRIELGTFVRAPGNQPCPQAPAKRSTIAAAEDQAIDMVVASDPSIFKVAPRFEAKACNEFSGNPPHPSPAGGTAWAKMAAAHYGLGK